MSTTPINTIPYNGGTININRSDICSVAISATKSVVFYAQSTPNLVYAHVVNTSGLEGGTPSSTNGPQFAFGVTAPRVRAYKMTDTRLFVLMGTEMRVIDIDANDNLTLRTAAVEVLFSPGLWYGAGTNSAISTNETFGNMNQGTTFTAIRLADDRLMIATRTNNNYQVAFATVTYDQTTDVLTRTAGAGWSTSVQENFSDNYHEVRFTTIPDSSNVFAYMVSRGGYISSATTRATATQFVEFASVLDTNARFIRNLNMTNQQSFDPANPTINAMLAVSESVFLGLRDGKSFRVHTGSIPTSPTNVHTNNRVGSFGNPVTFASNGEDTIVTHAEMINNDYFIMTMTPALPTTATGLNIGFEPQTVRIVRYIDPTFAEVIESSQTIESNSFGVPLNPDGAKLHRVGQYTYLFPTKTSATVTDTRVSLRSIFGGNA